MSRSPNIYLSMAIAHLCLTCGTDLARTRPRREPYYGLPIITCPKCAAVSVRRVHPIWSRWKNFRRVDAALRILATQLILAALLAVISTMLCISLLIALAGELRGKPEDHLGWVLFCSFAIAPVTGTWLTAGFSHLQRWRVWLGWWLFMVLLLIITAVICDSSDEMPPGLEQLRNARANIFLEALRLLVLPGALVQAVFMLAALVGIPIGKLLIRLTGRTQWMIWRMRRRSRRIGRVA